jgi:two-component system sensor histidine kinase CpxA
VLESTRSCSRLAERGGVRIVPHLVVVADDAPECELSGEATLLQTMLDNLVRNAVRHSPPGASVEIEAAAEDGRARIEVRDRGPGIPEDQLERVFDPFVRVTPECAPGGGTGLGLSIARRIAELHGGTIAAANREGGGSVFTVMLNAHSADS